MPSFGAERPTVQGPIISYVTESTIGWQYVPRDEAITRRGGDAGLFFHETLLDKLLTLNPGRLDKSLAEEIIKRLQNVRASIDGNSEILSFIRGLKSVFHPEHKRELNISLIDFDNLENNLFEVTDEWRYTNGRYTNRADIIFLINGIPLVIVEAKAAHKTEGMEEGVDHIRRYHRETPEMVTAPQMFDVPNLLQWYYGVTWNTDRKNLFNWKDEEPGNFERKVKAFFERERILRFLRDYILFIKKDDDLYKYILRQHQTRAVEKVVARAEDRKKRTGLIWHTQGSGKTFTMITTAEKILKHSAFEKPTVLMLVDRNELETQLFQNLEAYGFGTVVVAERKKHLRELLSSDYRGLIVSMIHKFEGMPANINVQDNVFVFVDEAHRTTSGDLGNYLMGALPNATYLGFTGTPIDKITYGRGTFKVFGRDDEKGYLDKYSIAESIEDGTTLELHYTLAPNDMLVDKETLEKEFLSLAEAEGVSDVEELNKILERAVNLKTQLKADDRVTKVAEFVSSHYRETVEPMGYKAFLVGVDREACALYKNALDKHLPPEYSKVVYTSAHGDRELLKEFHLGGDEEKKIRKAFIKKNELPKILIVTEKLLTGFDAPVLYCMYLDKPMRDHVLLQAIARVNRPYEDDDGLKKPAGFVLDFVGIFDNLEKALSFDSETVASVIKDIDLLKKRFAELMEEKRSQYLDLVRGPVSDKTVEGAIEVFTDKEKRAEFFKFFKQIEALYEIISPDSFLREYIEDYNNLARLYTIVRDAFSKKIYVDRELMAKTAKLVKESVTAQGLEGTLPIYPINEDTLAAIKSGKSPDPVKVINLIKSLRVTIEEEGEDLPFLVSIGDMAELIAEHYDDRQINTQEALERLEKLIHEYNEAQREREEKGLDINTFSIYWTLKKASVTEPEEQAVKLNALFEAHKHWRVNPEELRKLKTELYKLLLSVMDKDKMMILVDRLMQLERK